MSTSAQNLLEAMSWHLHVMQNKRENGGVRLPAIHFPDARADIELLIKENTTHELREYFDYCITWDQQRARWAQQYARDNISEDGSVDNTVRRDYINNILLPLIGVAPREVTTQKKKAAAKPNGKTKAAAAEATMQDSELREDQTAISGAANNNNNNNNNKGENAAIGDGDEREGGAPGNKYTLLNAALDDETTACVLNAIQSFVVGSNGVTFTAAEAAPLFARLAFFITSTSSTINGSTITNAASSASTSSSSNNHNDNDGGVIIASRSRDSILLRQAATSLWAAIMSHNVSRIALWHTRPQEVKSMGEAAVQSGILAAVVDVVTSIVRDYVPGAMRLAKTKRKQDQEKLAEDDQPDEARAKKEVQAEAATGAAAATIEAAATASHSQSSNSSEDDEEVGKNETSCSSSSSSNDDGGDDDSAEIGERGDDEGTDADDVEDDDDDVLLDENSDSVESSNKASSSSDDDAQGDEEKEDEAEKQAAYQDEACHADAALSIFRALHDVDANCILLRDVISALSFCSTTIEVGKKQITVFDSDDEKALFASGLPAALVSLLQEDTRFAAAADNNNNNCYSLFDHLNDQGLAGERMKLECEEILAWLTVENNAESLALGFVGGDSVVGRCKTWLGGIEDTLAVLRLDDDLIVFDAYRHDAVQYRWIDAAGPLRMACSLFAHGDVDDASYSECKELCDYARLVLGDDEGARGGLDLMAALKQMLMSASFSDTLWFKFCFTRVSDPRDWGHSQQKQLTSQEQRILHAVHAVGDILDCLASAAQAELRVLAAYEAAKKAVVAVKVREERERKSIAAGDTAAAASFLGKTRRQRERDDDNGKDRDDGDNGVDNEQAYLSERRDVYQDARVDYPRLAAVPEYPPRCFVLELLYDAQVGQILQRFVDMCGETPVAAHAVALLECLNSEYTEYCLNEAKEELRENFWSDDDDDEEDDDDDDEEDDDDDESDAPTAPRKKKTAPKKKKAAPKKKKKATTKKAAPNKKPSAKATLSTMKKKKKKQPAKNKAGGKKKAGGKAKKKAAPKKKAKAAKKKKAGSKVNAKATKKKASAKSSKKKKKK